MFVYLTTCKINGKKYIGKYEGKESDNYLGSGKLLRRAIKKYGAENFTRTVLEYFDNKEDARSAEKRYIVMYNAVDSDEFYNIAEGGEGGNTYSGIKGPDRDALILKLKNRKKGDKSSYKNKVAALDLHNKTTLIVDQEVFFDTPHYVGVACRGLYITPFGNFTSVELMKTVIGIDYTSLVKKCKNNTKKIRKAHFQAMVKSTPYYNNLQKFIGLSFQEAGYSFIGIDELQGKSLEFYKKLGILKINQ